MIGIGKLKTITLIWALCSVSFASSYSGKIKTDKEAYAEQLLDIRPLKVGSIALSKELERLKPVGQLDHAGWAVSSDLIVGSVDPNWATAYSITKRRFQWWLPIEAGLTAPPKVSGSWVFLSDRTGSLKKVEVLSGKVVWEASFGSFTSRQLAISGTQIFLVTADQHLYSIDFHTGKVNWVYDGGKPTKMSVRTLSPPLLQSGLVFFGKADGSVDGVDQISGKRRFSTNVTYTEAQFNDVVGDVVLLGKTLVVSRFDGVVAGINIETGMKEWEKRYVSLVAAKFREGRLYLGGVQGDVIVLDVSSGKEVWKFAASQAISNLTVGEKTLYVSTAEGRVFALELSTGKLIWLDDLGGHVMAPPFIYSKSIYYSTGISHLYGFSLN